ncbi:MAG: coproporphyrinogen dehydrogenase HemZ [Ruminococcus sp.]
MNLYAINHSFHYELENLTRAFFPNDKIVTLSVPDLPEVLEAPYILTSSSDNLRVCVAVNGFERQLTGSHTDNDELILATMVYRLLCEYTGIELSWGLLTGVRPIKLLRSLIAKEGEAAAIDYFRNTLLVSEEKTALALDTCTREQKILDLSKDNSFSLYVSIPFCPTRCSYCSFVSQSVEKARHLIPQYVGLLCKEIAETGKLAGELGLRLESVYIGGGTPTTLDPCHLKEIMTAVGSSFDLSTCREYTVEAGRPDTITEEKLRVIYEMGCDRLSVNPQTLSNEVLENIGRKHTVEDFYSAFYLAEKIGFKHINTDLIAGLPGDTARSFRNTVDGICKLSPESVTVHTLSMKRSSYLTGSNLQLLRKDANAVSEMLSYAYQTLSDFEYRPYYLYRQSRMVGNMENTGWAKQGFEGLYNVYIMDETHTILACGAGAVTKLKDPKSTNIQRIFNFKYPYEYIDRFDELLSRKDAIKPFYDSLK